MSNDVNIHLSLEPFTHAYSLKVLEDVLECIAVPHHADSDGKQLTRFEQIRVYDTSFSRLALDESIKTNDVSGVLATLSSYVGPEFHYEINSVFDCFIFDDRSQTVQAEVRPLTISYFGPAHGWKGLEYKSYGLVRLDFSNTKIFRVPHTSMDHVNETAANRGDITKGLRTMAKVGRNFDAVSGVAKRLINRLDPTHLLICTELEVHPLTAHAIYHSDWREYSKDLEKIARLHENGGVYFCELAPGDPAFRAPRKSPPDYGYLRARYGDQTEEDFVEAIQPMVDEMLKNPGGLTLSKEQIQQCFQSLVDTEVEKLNNSYYLSVVDPPFAYLVEPYFRLYSLNKSVRRI